MARVWPAQECGPTGDDDTNFPFDTRFWQPGDLSFAAPGSKPVTRSRSKRAMAYARGRFAEKLCQWVLRAKGYRILETGYRTKVGEIDILATRGDLLVAVEVKVRATRAAAIEAVTWRQRRRIEKALEWYLRRNPGRGDTGIRFDVIAMTPWRLPSHIKNAWQGNQ
jgi:putative endonuclease